ncbi:MAG: serine/threonine protein kinase [Kiritimatiellae bacterium]|nr:serine/threonine protein kinase [Kiritimatiellia bacterium]
MSADIQTFNLPNMEIISLLGEGGMASVWKARQISLDRLVAIKVLSNTFSSKEDDIARFLQEARVAARLKHPGIVEIYDANFSSGLYYYIMEYISGYTFGSLMERKGRIALDDALTIAESVAIALDYAWDKFQLVHCDIKPDNIMVDSDGTVKITDLGLCHALKLQTSNGQDPGDEVLGTPAYISPEQVYGDTQLDCRSDIYELGATLYHMISGRMLFPGLGYEETMRCHVGEAQAPDIREIVPFVPAPVAMLLEKMLAKNPRFRHKDWKEVLADLMRIRENRIPQVAPIPPKGSSMERK